MAICKGVINMGSEGRPVVVIAEVLAASCAEYLGGSCDVVEAAGEPRGRLLELLAEAEGLVVRSGTQVDGELMDAAPRLRVVGRAGVGVDNIDLDEATRRGVLVVNAPLANSVSAAEHAFGLMLSVARNIARGDASIRSGRWDRAKFRGVELDGKTLGLVGMGRIGSLVAQRALAFGMKVLAYDPYITAEQARAAGGELRDLDSLLADSDFISLHLPRTPETENLLGREAFAKAKRGVRIVNASRGGIIDEEALVEAIRDGKVAGAALDVYAEEPMTGGPLTEVPEVVLTPHLGASTVEAQNKAGLHVAESVVAGLAGEPVMAAVNRVAGG
ncbi:MAG: hydroxyacid dehydrogenase [bacterium]|nr:hydroxyacid dehydrogenase [bacterium]MDE0438881.1 hydroxyacid dehydrogenase [bacterium]